MTRVLAVIAMLVTTSALTEGPYPTPTADGRQRIQRDLPNRITGRPWLTVVGTDLSMI